MHVKNQFQNSLLHTSMYITGSSTKLLNDVLKVGETDHSSEDSPIEMLFLNCKISHENALNNISEMLGKLTIAVGLEISQTQMIKLTSNEKILLPINVNKSIKRLFICGIPLDFLNLHLEFTPYEILHWSEIEIVVCDSLEIIMHDKLLKNKLWSVLKRQFNIS